MKSRMIQKTEWKSYFNLISRSLKNQKIEIEVAGLDIGDQIETEWTPFDGISYDTHTDSIYIHTPSLDHAIPHPQELSLIEVGDSIVTINIKDPEHSQMIHFHRPIELKGLQKDAHP